MPAPKIALIGAGNIGGTLAHLAALKTLGPCPAHRRSWGPIKALLEEA